MNLQTETESLDESNNPESSQNVAKKYVLACCANAEQNKYFSEKYGLPVKDRSQDDCVRSCLKFFTKLPWEKIDGDEYLSEKFSYPFRGGIHTQMICKFLKKFSGDDYLPLYITGIVKPQEIPPFSLFMLGELDNITPNLSEIVNKEPTLHMIVFVEYKDDKIWVMDPAVGQYRYLTFESSEDFPGLKDKLSVFFIKSSALIGTEFEEKIPLLIAQGEQRYIEIANMVENIEKARAALAAKNKAAQAG